jgi:hypothetical protein
MAILSYNNSISPTSFQTLKSLDIIRLANGVRKTRQIQGYKGTNRLGAHCKGNLTILRIILHLDLAKGNPK